MGEGREKGQQRERRDRAMKRILTGVVAGLIGLAFSTTGGLGSVSFPVSLGPDVQFNQQQSLNAQQNIQPLSPQ